MSDTTSEPPSTETNSPTPGASAGSLPDVSGISVDEWPARELTLHSGTRSDGFQVVYRRDVLDSIHSHGQSNTKVEVCGVLVGRVYRDSAGTYLLVDACIAGEAASHAANVTFTGATWSKIHDEMDRLYPEERIVGWYHTHPAFGIFLSEMDVFIQANFFNLPWQVAMVYDPIGGDEGTFVWRNGMPTREPVLCEPAPPATEEPTSLKADEFAALEDRLSVFDRVFVVMLMLFVAILLVLLIIYELRSTAPPPPGPVGWLQWSATAHGT